MLPPTRVKHISGVKLTGSYNVFIFFALICEGNFGIRLLRNRIAIGAKFEARAKWNGP